MERRIFDLAIAIPLLLLLAPVMLIIAALVRIGLGGPVLFRQPRAGLHGRRFLIWKFRTMRETSDARGRPLPDEQRLTRLGRILRAGSLDELPELINVIRGEMSLVGPRPLFPEYVPLYDTEQARRLEVRPGITGWAQINGRNAITWEDKFKLDVWYVDHRSLLLDAQILLRTVREVLRREGINHPGQATMEPFRGTRR